MEGSMKNSIKNNDYFINLENHYGAHNYDPLKVVLSHAKGVYCYDINNKKYIDMMSGYSAVSLGHANENILKTLKNQINHLGVTSRAFYNNRLPEMLALLSNLTGFEKAVPMNSGAEAVETALKIARKWGEKVKGVEKNKGEIIVCRNNFHGRTLGVISMSTEEQYRDGFGPFLPGFKFVNYGDINDLKKTISSNTVAFLVEPIQGEAGIITPPKNYLKEVKKVCNKNNVLYIADEIQCGLARTGKLFYSEGADLMILGKALGGGIYPVSAVCGKESVMSVLNPGDHGSTFGGNAIAASIAIQALKLLSKKTLLNHVKEMGEFAMSYLTENLKGNVVVKDIRGEGLFIGIEVNADVGAKKVVDKMLEKGVLSKDTHHTVIRLAPPLIIKRKQLKKALKIIVKVLNKMQ
jgi:ornithine--oxo-acid transaminase